MKTEKYKGRKQENIQGKNGRIHIQGENRIMYKERKKQENIQGRKQKNVQEGNRKIYREETGEYIGIKKKNVQEGNRRINKEETRK